MKLPASYEDVCVALGLPPDFCPRTAEEAELFYERAIDLFRGPTTSGYHFVLKSGKKWQAIEKSIHNSAFTCNGSHWQ